MQAPTPQGSVPAGPISITEAVNAISSILPDEGEQSIGETQVEEGKPNSAALEEDLLESADASNDETDSEQSENNEESEEESQPQTFTVKVDGQEVSVTLDELQKGYSRTQDYTRKTQQIAEVRKQVEQEAEAIRAERSQYAQLLGALQVQVQQAAEPQIDWDRLYQEDPIEWVRQKEVMRENQEKARAIQSEQQRLNQISQHEQAQTMQQFLAQEQEQLLKVLPSWSDPAKAKAEKSMLIEFGQKAGFAPDELKNIFDHRVVSVLRKAALYEQMVSKRGNIKPVVNNGPRPAKPGAAGRVSNMTESTRAQQRLAKTGRVDDAADAIYKLLG
jgi:hypothetical protein